MYIKSIILDGFKSYGRRTEIHGFDAEFTAITGLNGTGKSNILDAICFVLGLSNLGHVRAATFQDLVYKSGQAGITKATVSIVFDNSNASQCPMGYEKCREISVTRQIVVGGKNKYYINGKIVQNKKVSDFFCSILLNVNNPNFLIMQGRITKVLNMKPQEILSMIEEAAGTSLYETKREASTKLIEKKDAKVQETNTLLLEEVEPKLEKLREERAAYVEYQKLCRDIEFLTRINISFRYLKKKEALNSTEATLTKLSSRIDVCRSTIDENNSKSVQISEDAKCIQLKIDEEMGGLLLQLEKELSEKLVGEASVSGKIKAAKSILDKEESKMSLLDKNICDDEDALQQKETKMANLKNLYSKLKEADAKDAASYEQSQIKFEGINKGLSANEDGQLSSIHDQLIGAKEQVSVADTTIKTSTMELNQYRKELIKKKANMATQDSGYIKDQNMHDKLLAETEELRQKLINTNYTVGTLEESQEEKSTLTQRIRQLKSQLDCYSQYELAFTNPEPNFDRSKLRGMVGKLFRVIDKNNGLALTIAGGGSIYSYVTDDDITSKKIIQKGKLQHRVTIIPMNKISSSPIPKHVVDFAKNLVGKENVHTALSLIEFDPYFEPVMKFVFGNALICRDLHIAKQLTYNKNINCRTVTLQGDVVDPDGSLSGGSKPKGANILEELAKVHLLESELAARQAELSKLQKIFASIEQNERSYNHIKKNLDVREHELNACKERLAKTAFEQQKEEIKSLELTIKNLENDILQAQELRKIASAKVKEIEEKLSDSKGYRERELKAASEEMKIAKKKAEESNKNWRKHEQEFETVQLEINDLSKSIVDGKNQRNILLAKLEKLKSEYELIKKNSISFTEKISELKQTIKNQKENLNSQHKELNNLLLKDEKLKKQSQELTLEIKKKENEVNKVRNDSKEEFRKIEDLEKKYTWIIEDKEFFGIKNTRYDYSKEDPIKAGQKLTTMHAQKEKMERQVNQRAMMLLDREEEQYQETIRRRKIVEQDKEKIKHIICKMDEKKREKVEKAYKIVDQNFSSIFSTLLPGAQARLKPSIKENQLIGLEINVGFNGVWKESLGELSGGQRSLVALSLVLSMLKFSPAPLYILDEVDAALDMSHTQNIGNMLKTHFTSSQFIIVSLKDGMFNNANVVFRTKFVEGNSTVEREVLQHGKKK